MFGIVSGASLRTIVALFLVAILAKVMGRRIISQMNFYDFVVTVVIGAVTANLALSKQRSPASGATVLIVIAAVTLIIEYLRVKSFFFRKTLDSEIVVLVENGKIVDENLSKTRLTLNELMMQLRQKIYLIWQT